MNRIIQTIRNSKRLDVHSQVLADKIVELENELKHAEERAAHHAEIARICSATAERYEAVLWDILHEIPNPSLPVTKAIARLAREALKEAE